MNEPKEAEPPRCRKCGCNDVRTLTLVVALGRETRRRKCRNCGHEWRTQRRDAGSLYSFETVSRCPTCNEPGNVYSNHGGLRYFKCSLDHKWKQVGKQV